MIESYNRKRQYKLRIIYKSVESEVTFIEIDDNTHHGLGFGWEELSTKSIYWNMVSISKNRKVLKRIFYNKILHKNW